MFRFRFAVVAAAVLVVLLVAAVPFSGPASLTAVPGGCPQWTAHKNHLSFSMTPALAGALMVEALYTISELAELELVEVLVTPQVLDQPACVVVIYIDHTVTG